MLELSSHVARTPFHAWSSLIALLGGAALTVACSGGASMAPPHDAGTDAEAAGMDAGTDAGASTDAGRDAEVDDDAGALDIVTKPDGKTPSNFACNHHFVDPPAEAVVPHEFAVSAVAAKVVTPVPASSGTLTLIDPSTGSTAGMPSASINAAGAALLGVAGNTRAAWKVSADATVCDPCIDSYEFNRLVGPDLTAAIAPVHTTVFEIDHASGWSESSGFLANEYLIGTILDCDGDPVMNASISVAGATLCWSQDAGSSTGCFLFPHGEVNPEFGYTSTGALGQFVVYTRMPGPVSVQAIGRLSPSDESPSVIGTLDAITFQGNLSWGTTSPLRK